MDDKERVERVKMVKSTGMAITVLLVVLSACMIFLGTAISEPGEIRFTLLMISAGAGVLAAVFVLLTFWRVEKLKSRRTLFIGAACMTLSVAAMLTLALVSLLT